MPTLSIDWKEKKLRNVRDGQEFKISLRSYVSYTLIKKEKGKCIYTSNESNLSFTRPGDLKVYTQS